MEIFHDNKFYEFNALARFAKLSGCTLFQSKKRIRSHIMKYCCNGTRLRVPLRVLRGYSTATACLWAPVTMAVEVVQIAVATATLHYMPPFQLIRRNLDGTSVWKLQVFFIQGVCVYSNERGVCQFAINDVWYRTQTTRALGNNQRTQQ